jgi:hypothetical protein
MDIYAVGLLAYELITGVSPFTGPSPRETLAAQLTRDPQPLHELSPAVPRSLSELIMRCLAKDPNARPQRADDILQELDAMTMPMGMTPQRGGIEAPRKRKPWAGVAAVAILFAVLAGVGYAVTRDHTPAKSAVTAPNNVVIAPQSASPESVTKRAAAAANITATPPKPAPVITHEDSVAIAKAVEKKLAQARSKDSLAKARLAEETQRKMMDSIIAANSGGAAAATATGPRRLVIAEPADIRQWPEASLLGRAVGDSLRRMLRARPRQYTAVDQDSVRMLLARTRDINELTKTMGSDLLVSIRLTALPQDSAMLMIQIYDLTATNAYRSRTAANRQVGKNEVLANLDALLLSTLTYLDEMSRAPRRTSTTNMQVMPNFPGMPNPARGVNRPPPP